MSSNLNWSHLLSLAEGEVTEVMQGLAPALHKQAERVTVIYDRKPSRKLIADGIEEDTLGLFVGSDFAQEMHAAPVPQQIILYLENIWDMAEGDEEFFRDYFKGLRVIVPRASP